jgi:hypothetical protein
LNIPEDKATPPDEGSPWSKWLGAPKATTFGNSPIITDLDSRKAYQTWLVVRLVYEVVRWLSWVALLTVFSSNIASVAGLAGL